MKHCPACKLPLIRRLYTRHTEDHPGRPRSWRPVGYWCTACNYIRLGKKGQRTLYAGHPAHSD